MLPRTILTGWIALLIVFSSLTYGDDSGKEYRYRVTVKSEMNLRSVKGETREVATKSVYEFTLRKSPRKITVYLDFLSVRNNSGGQVSQVEFSKNKFRLLHKGKWKEVPVGQVDPRIKLMVEHSFGKPLCHLHLDREGREVRREVVADKGTETLIKNGLFANGLFFLSMFGETSSRWKYPRKLSIGYGGFALGKLNYKKKSDPYRSYDDPVKVTVSGTLKGKAREDKLELRDAKYEVKGEQEFLPTEKVWSSAEHRIKFKFAIYQKNAKTVTATGKMSLKAKRLTS